MCDVPLLVLDFGLDIVDGVRGLNLEGDGLTREAARDRKKKLISGPLDAPENNDDSRLDEDLHLCRRSCLSNELNGGGGPSSSGLATMRGNPGVISGGISGSASTLSVTPGEPMCASCTGATTCGTGMGIDVGA